MARAAGYFREDTLFGAGHHILHALDNAPPLHASDNAPPGGKHASVLNYSYLPPQGVISAINMSEEQTENMRSPDVCY